MNNYSAFNIQHSAFSVIIPVWNGESVIRQCLDAVYAHSGTELHEVICVDNASQDESAAVIAHNYPQVRLLPQPVNLGFAGGVNAGLEAATGHLLVLLNQDCLLQPGCLTKLAEAFAAYPTAGIAGCTLLEQDGRVNHAGAVMERPLAYGRHLTDIKDNQPQPMEYVTGTVFAITRTAWETIGRFDDDFYPAYYEETDYCTRARHKGFEVLYVPQAQAVHLHSSREWQVEPTKHTTNQHRARYRFVCKQFSTQEMQAFFAAEETAVSSESYFDQAIGRAMAARDTLRDLPRILAVRQRDLGEILPPAPQRQLSVGFTKIWRTAFLKAEQLCLPQFEALPALPVVPPPVNLAETWETAVQQLNVYREQEYDLLRRIYFRAPTDTQPESATRRLFRLLILRPLSFLTGRDYLLQSQLNTLHVARMDDLVQLHYRLAEHQNRLVEHQTQLTHYQNFLAQYQERQHIEAMQKLLLQEQKLLLLRTLSDYDYR